MAVNQASVLTSHLKTHPSLLYRKVAEDQLDQATLMHMWGVPRPIEQGHSEIQLHRYSLGAENMVPQNEGQVGAGSQIGDSIFKMKPAYYGDFVIISDNVAIEVYSDYRKNSAFNLGTRASTTIDVIHRNIFDGGIANYTVTPIGKYLTRHVVGQVGALLAEGNVMGGESDGMYGAVVSPLASYDLVHDPQAGGISDLAKGLDTGEIKRGAAAKMVTVTGNVRVYNSTRVSKPSSGKRRCYFFGRNGYAYTHFVGRAPQLGMTRNRNFNLIVHTAERGSIFDPTGRLRMSMAYRFTLGVAFLDQANWRVRTIDIDVSIGT